MQAKTFFEGAQLQLRRRSPAFSLPSGFSPTRCPIPPSSGGVGPLTFFSTDNVRRHAKQVLGEDRLCWFVHGVVERLELRRFLVAYSEEGGVLYHPSLILKVWLYAYLLGVTSSRRLEQRIREDLAFRYLAGGLQPDYWALNAFRRRHGHAINDVFVQVLEMAQGLGLARVGTVAIDSTWVKANASADRVEKVEQARQERAGKRRGVRRWQKACDADDPNEGAGMSVGALAEKLKEMSPESELEPLPKLAKRSLTDADSRFLRERGDVSCWAIRARSRSARTTSS